MGQLPKDAHGVYLANEIMRTYPELGPNCYLDLMPFAPSMLVTGTPETHHQIAQEHLLHKLPNLKNFVRPIDDGLGMLTILWRVPNGRNGEAYSIPVSVQLI